MAGCRFFLLALVLLAALTGCAVKPNPKNMTPQQRLVYDMLVAHGMDQFRKVERVDFTFNVESGENRNSRSWTWRPGSNLVTFDKQFTFQRSQARPGADPKILHAHQRFMHDSFWLLMPLQLEASRNVTLEETGQVIPPLGHEPLRRVVVTFSATGGDYHAGDVYELFLDQEHFVRESIFRRGGTPEPDLICTWEGYRRVGPMLLALDHVNKEAGFRLWFTHVTVHTTDGQVYTVAGP